MQFTRIPLNKKYLLEFYLSCFSESLGYLKWYYGFSIAEILLKIYPGLHLAFASMSLNMQDKQAYKTDKLMLQCIIFMIV